MSILALTAVSELWIGAHPAPHNNATLTYWTFAKPHYEAYNMIQFSDSDAGLGLEECLFQRGGAYFDPKRPMHNG